MGIDRVTAQKAGGDVTRERDRGRVTCWRRDVLTIQRKLPHTAPHVQFPGF